MEKVAGAEDMGGTPRELARSAFPAAATRVGSVRPDDSVASILATRAGPHRVRHLQIALGEPWSRWLLSLRSVSLDTFLSSGLVWGVVVGRNGLRSERFERCQKTPVIRTHLGPKLRRPTQLCIEACPEQLWLVPPPVSHSRPAVMCPSALSAHRLVAWSAAASAAAGHFHRLSGLSCRSMDS